MKQLIIAGAVGTCLDIAEAAIAGGKYILMGFLDDGFPKGHMTPLGLPVLGGLRDAPGFEEAFFLNGIGSPDTFHAKQDVAARLGISNPERFATVIHPSAVISPTARLASGCAVLAHCSVGAGAFIDSHCILLQNCVVGHDSAIGAYCSLAAGVILSGNITVGRNCYLGAGVAVREKVTIGAGSLIGLGSAVVADVPPNAVFFGNPARSRATA